VHMRELIVVIVYARASRVVFHANNYRVGCLYIIHVQLKTDIWPQIWKTKVIIIQLPMLCPKSQTKNGICKTYIIVRTFLIAQKVIRH